MATAEQIARGVMAWADAEIAPALDGIKQVFVGAGLEFYIRKKLPALVEGLGVADADGSVDVEMLADALRRRVAKLPNGLEIKIPLNPFNKADVDVFRIRADDVDKLAEYIREEGKR